MKHRFMYRVQGLEQPIHTKKEAFRQARNLARALHAIGSKDSIVIKQYRETKTSYIQENAFEVRQGDPSYCNEHGCFFVECGHLGHGKDYDPKQTL